MRSFPRPTLLAPVAAALVLAACSVAPVAPVTPSASATAAPAASPNAAATPTAAPSAAAPPAASPTPAGPQGAVETLAYTAAPGEDPLPVTTNQRLKTQAELTALLDKIKAAKTGRPTVDFTKQEVLAFYDAGGPNGCYELTLLELLNKGAVLTPVFAEKPKPGVADDRVCTMAIVAPRYLLVAIAKSPLPVAGIDQGASPAPNASPSTK